MTQHTSSSLISYIHCIGKMLSDLVYPPLCAVCHTRLNACELAVCSHCGSKLSLYYPERYRAEERLFASSIFRNYYSLYTYRRASMEQCLMQAYKYGANHTIGNFIVERARLSLSLTPKSYDLILAIPLSRERLSQRGFNQSLLLAERLGEYLLAEASDKYIIRKENTDSHTTLTGLDRRLASEALFIPNPKHSIVWTDMRVLVVDDVLTTGATLISFLSLLEDLGVASADVFTAMTSV